MDGDALAAMHRIGYTDAVPEVPQWLSAEAKDFLARCLIRQDSHRCTAGQLLEHPFLASAAGCEAKLSKWVSPKSTLDAAFWESESDTEDELSASHSSAKRIIKELACSVSALPDWDSDEGWIDVFAAPTEASDSDAVAVPAVKTTDLEDAITAQEPSRADSGGLDIIVASSDTIVLSAGEANDGYVRHSRHQQSLEIVSACHDSK